MGDKKILVLVSGGTSEEKAHTKSGQKVIWEPDDSSKKIKITFVGSVPFKGWRKKKKKSKTGNTVDGTVEELYIEDTPFEYTAQIQGSPLKPTANPQLIVDGGGRKSTHRSQKTARKSKKTARKK